MTATGSAPSSCAQSSAATALSTPPDIATSVRPRSGVEPRVGADRRAERARERVRREVGGVALAEAQAAERAGDVVASRSARRRGSARRAASSTAALAAAIVAPQPSASKPASVTTLALDREIDADDVAAGRAPGRGRVRPGGHVPAPAREAQMLLEALVRHRAGV